MPLFPCDNTEDIVPDEMYDIVRDNIDKKRAELGRELTQEEIDACYRAEDLEPPTESYRSSSENERAEEEEL